ncbi:MAG TPA: hypothetical protein VN605_06765, partial [Thermoanaerobaculia bacterium]|nr:hypothetical protein [Thermoanaerobaculia bacterium]
MSRKPFTAIAIAVACLVTAVLLVRERARTPRARLEGAWRELACRPMVARLDEFDYRPRPSSPRGPVQADAALSETIAAASAVARTCGNDRSRFCAVAHLLAGHIEPALANLTRTTNTAGDACDTAAAYLDRGRRNRDPHD